MKQMDIPYLRACHKMTLFAQDKLFAASPFAKLARLAKDDIGASTARTWLLEKKLRKGHSDRVLVTRFDRLAPNARELREVFHKIEAAGATVFEITTGRSSAKPSDLLAMTDEAKDFYAGRPTGDELSAWGSAGAAQSPVTKAKTGHMPLRDMDAILDDHSLTLDQAVARINADKRYKTKVSKSWVQRRRAAGILKYRHRISGHGKR